MKVAQDEKVNFNVSDKERTRKSKTLVGTTGKNFAKEKKDYAHIKINIRTLTQLKQDKFWGVFS